MLQSLIQHPFITYTFILSILCAVALWIGLAVAGKKRPRTPWLFALPMGIPILSYLLNYMVFAKACSVVERAYTGFWSGFPSLHLTCMLNQPIISWIGPISWAWLGMSLIYYFLRWFKVWRLMKMLPLSLDQPDLSDLLSSVGEMMETDLPRLRLVEAERPIIFTVGTWRKTMVISTGTLAILEEDELRAAVAHELAHICRFASGLTWLVLFLRDVMMFSPASLWAYTLFRQEEERSCDALAVERTGLRLPLASALVKFMKNSADRLEPLLNMLTGEHPVVDRVHMLLSDSPTKRPVTSYWLAPVVGIGLGLLFFVC